MRYETFQDKDLSLLGFGAMRLPLTEEGAVDEEQTARMVDYAMEHGVNYFDTAYPYHDGLSEIILCRALSRYPRDSYYLADKYPGHQIAETYDVAATFEEQLRKCDVDHFDFYLLHNVYEKSIETYFDERWGIPEYLIEQRRAGRIKHLGFSTHGSLGCMRRFLERYGAEMEFCQIQLNYLDWDLQEARQKCELLAEYGLPVIVMEPLRGGALANLGEEDQARIEAVAPGQTPVSLALRFAANAPGVKVVLSGMSDFAQMTQNVATFEKAAPLSTAERTLLEDIADGMRDDIPCTNCRYCCDSCPMELDIPGLLHLYNDTRVTPSFNVGMLIDAMPADKRPSACTACGSCAQMCPQNIDIPTHLAEFAELQAKVPHWEDLCRAREEAARKLRESMR